METFKSEIKSILQQNKDLRSKIDENLNFAIKIAQDQSLKDDYSFDVFVLKFLVWYEQCENTFVINGNEVLNRYFAKKDVFYKYDEDDYIDTIDLTNYFKQLYERINSLLNENNNEKYEKYCREEIEKFLKDKLFLEVFKFIYENNIDIIKVNF